MSQNFVLGEVFEEIFEKRTSICSILWGTGKANQKRRAMLNNIVVLYVNLPFWLMLFKKKHHLLLPDKLRSFRVAIIFIMLAVVLYYSRLLNPSGAVLKFKTVFGPKQVGLKEEDSRDNTHQFPFYDCLFRHGNSPWKATQVAVPQPRPCR